MIPRVQAPVCETCRRPTVACVCDRVVSFPTARRVLVLQHPQEQDAILGSAQILTACLPKAKLVVGLSWRNFADALGEPDADARKWAVLFPAGDAPGNSVATRRGVPVEPSSLEGVVVLDGTWSKAKALWWRNPWLSKMNRMRLHPSQPSIYGSLRAEPKREYVSTLESVAAALTLCGEPREIEVGLARIFRTLVQRVRDAHVIRPRRSPQHSQGKRARRGSGTGF
jgi:DTW domain-containing protein YfiP